MMLATATFKICSTVGAVTAVSLILPSLKILSGAPPSPRIAQLLARTHPPPERFSWLPPRIWWESGIFLQAAN
jgi:hypothetical protein